MFLTAEFTPRSDLQFIFTGIAQQIYLEALIPSLLRLRLWEVMFNLTDMQTPLRAQAQLDATIHTLHLVDQYHPHLLLRQLLLHLVSYVFNEFFAAESGSQQFASSHHHLSG